MKGKCLSSGLVYSTDSGRMCPQCRQSLAQCSCRTAVKRPVGDGIVRVSLQTKGRLIADLPGDYLCGFVREGVPKGEIGRLLALMHEIDHDGLSDLLTPLRGG